MIREETCPGCGHEGHVGWCPCGCLDDREDHRIVLEIRRVPWWRRMPAGLRPWWWQAIARRRWRRESAARWRASWEAAPDLIAKMRTRLEKP